MSLKIERYTHVPLYVDAVQVTAENMVEVASWVNGAILFSTEHKKQYIKIDAVRPMHDRQTEAYVGNWVLKTDMGWKVYTAKAFERGFIPAPVGAATV